MALIPWNTRSLEALKAFLGRDPANDRRLLVLAAMVADRIAKAAPDAPEYAEDEAMVRAISFLLEVGSGATSRSSIGEETLTLAPPSAWWTRSGAASVLAPYIVRRAGKVE